MHRLVGWTICWSLCLAFSVGCQGPVKICTEVKGQLDNPLKDTESLRQMPVDPLAKGCGKIALIDVDGVLLNMNMTAIGAAGDNPVESFREKLDTVASEGGFQAVIVRINSPGGGVTASDVMWRDLQAFKARTGLPVIACVMDVAAGGAYYLATGADQIYAHPTSLTGGISVILNRYNLEDLGGVVNVKYRPIKSGKYADLGTPMETMNEEAEEVLQSAAREFHVRFQEVVRQSRPLRIPAEPLDDGSVKVSLQDQEEPPMRLEDLEQREYEEFPVWCDGRVFTSGQSLEMGLIDRIGYLDDAIAAARSTAGCPDAQVVILHRRKDPARSPYAITPNNRASMGLLNVSVPGLERSRLPTFLYMWLMDPSLDADSGR